ncbi:MAG: Glycerol-3-phosphate dehydrogenase (NAD(P)+) [Candidatus Bathyarchaeota archaeon BA1]|nr:MAG: Glycerol-3-phosphate dehydrogenase (NAD(P)+) [Candidatus Bathyarchaeota archaeon BA1]
MSLRVANRYRTANYRVTISKDVVGVEICAALKNSYAIIVGACDGIMRRKGQKDMNNTKALVFSSAVGEMRRFVTAMGGDEETVLGLAGIGDLEVTCKGGRNSEFGCLLGSGMRVDEALNEMQRRGLTVEGHPTAKKAYRLALKLEMEGKLKIQKDLPLVSMVYHVLYQSGDVGKKMISFVSKIQ